VELSFITPCEKSYSKSVGHTWVLIMLTNHDAIKHHFHDIDWDVKFDNSYYCISGVMVSVLTSSMVDHGFEPRSGQTKRPKTIKLVFVAFPLSTLH
jgi:hypothetical protein